MDLARAYDYSDVNNSEVEWYTAPRCLFFRDGQTNGYWTSPYFDAGAGNINMVTYSQPMYSGKKFLGIATIDIEVDALCFGNQCSKICAATEYGYNISSKCNKYNVRDILYFSKTQGAPCWTQTLRQSHARTCLQFDRWLDLYSPWDNGRGYQHRSARVINHFSQTSAHQSVAGQYLLRICVGLNPC